MNPVSWLPKGYPHAIMLPDRGRGKTEEGRGEREEGRKKGTAKYAKYAEGTFTDRNVCSARRRTQHAGRVRSPDAKHTLPSDGRGGKRSQGRRGPGVGAKDACR